MANPEHVAILEQGVKAWNQWRKKQPNIQPDLSRANLYEQKLSGINFSQTYLYGASLFRTSLHRAQFIEAHLHDADLSASSLNDTDFTDAFFSRTNLTKADMNGANFFRARLREVSFVRGNLDNAILTEATLEQSLFEGVDLRKVKGLETVKHLGPSIIGLDTIIRSHGKIPEVFLRGAGMQEPIIEQIPALIGSLNPIDYYSCFISYSSIDQDFADQLYDDLQNKGVRCWFAPHDLRIGDRFPDRIEESILFYDKLLIVLSENSVKSTWVEDECRAALEKEIRLREEQQLNKTALFPIKLDAAIKEATSQWVYKIRRERHIGDFTNWKNHDKYQKAFERLLRDLKAAG